MKKLQNWFMLFIFFAALIPAAIPYSASAQAPELTEVTITPDGAGGYDTYISLTNLYTNYGSETTMMVGETSTDDKGRALMNFDLSTLPLDAEVITASLTLTVAEDLATNAGTLEIYPVIAPWVESETWWTRYAACGTCWWTTPQWSVPWEVAGAEGATDTSDELVTSVSLAADLAQGAKVTITIPAEFAGNLMRANYKGFILRTSAETNDAYKFYTSDALDEANRPALTLEYDPSPIVNDPGWFCIDGLMECTPYMPDNVSTSPFHVAAPGGFAIPNSFGGAPWEGYDAAIAVGALIDCDPYPYCRNDYPIYYRIVYSYEWESQYQDTVWATTTLRISGSNEVIAAQETPICYADEGSSNTIGHCKGVMIGIIQPEQIQDIPNRAYDIYVKTQMVFTTGYPVESDMTLDVYLSRQAPVESCSDTYVVPVPYTFEIDPTIETPVGMVGEETPVDEQGYPLTLDTMHMLKVEGMWNDGEDDRTDTAISFDGTTYIPLQEFIFSEDVLCYDISTLDPNLITVYFMATSETLYIRANDEASEFGDNTIPDPETPLTYTIGEAYMLILSGCAEQFTYDKDADWVASLVLFADEPSTLATDDLQSEEWYAVEVVSGAWRELPQLEPLQTMDYVFTNAFTGTWEPLADGSDSVECISDTNNGYIAFIQARDISLYLRASDLDDNFEDNQGSLRINIYHAAFERAQEACELSFALDEIQRSSSVDAKLEFGKTMGLVVGTAVTNSDTDENFLSYGLVPGAWYALETYGGPWGYQGSMHGTNAMDYDMAISVGAPNIDGVSEADDFDWVPLSEWEGAECSVPTDTLGHRLVYFQTPVAGAYEYKLRVNDWSDWTTNSGVMSWNLYRAIDLGPAQTQMCDYTYTEPPLNTEPLTVRANYADGAYIQTGIDTGELSPNTYYAVELLTSEYQWYEEANGDPQTEMELSLNNGTSWSDLPNGALCAITTGNNYIFFIRSGADVPLFKLRVNSTTFEDNTEFMAYNIYTAEAGTSINPYDGCVTEGYSTTTLTSYQWIPVRDDTGIGITATEGLSDIPELIPGNRYIVETSRGPWFDGETTYDNSTNLKPLTSAQVSSDGGATWQNMDGTNTDITCWEYTPDMKYYKIEFTVVEGQDWRIRVADTETDIFTDNTGNLAFTLKGLVLPADTTVTGTFSLAGCNTPPVFPGLLGISDLLNLGNYLASWYDYIIGSIIKFFAWCPENTAAVTMFGQEMTAREPFATLDEFEGVLADVKNELQGYNWGAEEDYSVLTKSPGESAAMIEEYVFGPLPDDSPWMGGQLLDFSEDVPLGNYFETCNSALAEYVGPTLGQGVCFSSNWAKQVGLIFWVQMLLDVGVIFLCIREIVNTAKSLVYLITGVNFGVPKS